MGAGSVRTAAGLASAVPYTIEMYLVPYCIEFSTEFGGSQARDLLYLDANFFFTIEKMFCSKEKKKKMKKNVLQPMKELHCKQATLKE